MEMIASARDSGQMEGLDSICRNCTLNGEPFVWSHRSALPRTGLLQLDLAHLSRPQDVDRNAAPMAPANWASFFDQITPLPLLQVRRPLNS